MKLQKTIKIKIGKLSNNKNNLLDILIRKNTKAVNFCLNKAKKGKLITHNLVYKDLRELNLPATVIHGCRAKSVEILKSYKKRKGKKTFPVLKNSTVRFDNQIVKLRHTDNKLYPKFVSLLYKAGKNNWDKSCRIELPLIINSDYQGGIVQQIGEEYKLGATELVKKGDNYFIHISYSKEINLPIPDKSFSPIGVDIGINNLAVSVAQSSVKFFNGERINWKNKFFRTQRHKLQQNLALQEIKRLRERQTRYNDFYLHNIAKDIVEQAKQEEKPVIVLEDLTHIKDTAKVRKNQRAKHSDWVFRRLQRAIEYKANWDGITVVYINPYHSSQTCSKCGELNKRNKHTYKCKSCGFECNSDYNAGRNIQQFFLAKCQEEQASINNASNPLIQEPKAKSDIGVSNLNRMKEVAIPSTIKVSGILARVL